MTEVTQHTCTYTSSETYTNQRNNKYKIQNMTPYWEEEK